MDVRCHGLVALVVALLAACAPTPIPIVPIERSLRTDDFIRGCAHGQAPACVVAGLRYLRESRLDPPKRIGAGKLFERACVLGRADGCHGAGFVSGVLDAVTFYDLACAGGHRAGCERAAELRGTWDKSCEPVAHLPGGGTIPLPDAHRHARPVLGQAQIYPPEAVAAGYEGEVTLCVRLSSQGRVVSARVLRDLPLLGESARATVTTWQFAPVRVGDADVPITRTVRMTFRVE